MSGDTTKWLDTFPNSSVDSFEKLKKVFLDKWAEKKDIRFILNALTSIKRKENETIEDFNNRFDRFCRTFQILISLQNKQS